MEKPKEVVEAVQELLHRFRSERSLGRKKTYRLELTEDQKNWLGRAVHIYQAHEAQTPKHWKDRLFTEACVEDIMFQFMQQDQQAPPSDPISEVLE